MSRWQIDPSEITTVLEGVVPQKEQLEGELTEEKFAGIGEGLTWGSMITGVVPNALSLLLSDQSAALSNVVNRVNAGVLGVSNATIAYNNGQEDMLGNFQREMLEASVDGDFSYFEANGHRPE
ncbi:DUF6507 family protein [Pseudactinotalea terrae]|uniref:DUF6507 family protein n=1 Tax=Pseudactinotalea terrae TaxID=1743262 RepID=UPI0012E2590B|nr:DUF6507 family protein [Pseudactinotalea terrae]